MANVLDSANDDIVISVMKLTKADTANSPMATNHAFILASFGYNILATNNACPKDIIDGILSSIHQTLVDPSGSGKFTRNLVYGQLADDISEQAYMDLTEFIKSHKLNPLPDGVNSLIDSLIQGLSIGNTPRSLDYNVNIAPFAKEAINRIPALIVNVLGYVPINGNRICGISNMETLNKVTGEELFPGNPELTNRCKSYLLQANYMTKPTEDYRVTEPESNKFFNDFANKIIANGAAALGNLKSYLESDYSRFGEIKPPETFLPAAAAASHQNPSADDNNAAEPPKQSKSSAPAAPAATLSQLPPESIELLNNMAFDNEQLMQAADVIMGNTYYNVPLITTYHPGITEKAVAQLLDTCTDRGEHRPFRVTAGDPRERKTVMIPPAFKEDKVPAIWSRAVIGSLGFPFVNFTCPPIMEIIRGTDPKSIKSAYKSVKPLFRECGLKKPIETLKEFAHAKYRNCTLNAVSVDAEELFQAEPGSTVSAGIIDPYSKVLKVKGSANIPLDFLTAFYGVLSPVNAVSQYCELTGMDTRAYLDTLATTGKPPIYILNPKKCSFRRGPKGSLFHELFSSKTAPVLVRARVSTHDGGFIMPEKLADLLFAV